MTAAFGNFTQFTGLWDCVLREIDRDGYSCEIVQDLLRFMPAPEVEAKIAKARERRALMKPPIPDQNKEHFLDKLEKKKDV